MLLYFCHVLPCFLGMLWTYVLSSPRCVAASWARCHVLLYGAAGTGGGGLELVEMSGPIVKVRITGPAASVMTVRVAVTQKLREKFPAIAAVQLMN